MADKEALRSLKIKTGVVARTKKELAMYQKEVAAESAKLEKMKAEGVKDAHDIKHQVDAHVTSTLKLTPLLSSLIEVFLAHNNGPTPPSTHWALLEVFDFCEGVPS